MTNPRRQAFAQARADLPAGEWHRQIGKAGLAVAIAGVLAWLLADRLSEVSLDDARSHLLAVAPGQWLAAGLATLVGFWAVGHYDDVIHRYLATCARPSDARRAGATAIAISQTLGLGVITGAIVRWRMLPDQNLWQATRITAIVALFFLSGWAVVTALVLATLPIAPFKSAALLVLGAFAALIIICAIAPKVRTLHLPNLFVITRLLALTTVDTLAAATALWVLCPPDLALPLTTLLPAFLLAFGAGLISGAPGGVGAFEITLLALLPQVPEAPLLAGIIAWRVVYFAAPALLGAAFAIRGPNRNRQAAQLRPRPALTKVASRAEAGLLAQGHLDLLAAGHDQAWLSGRTAHCLIGLLDPMSDDPKIGAVACDHKRAITCLIDRARLEHKLPVIYKCTARTAVAARRLGLFLRPVGREAWLDPRNFALDTPSRAGLRRKLRRAAAAGITITTEPQDWDQLSRIVGDWVKCHGAERGFSMGRFDRNYLIGQRLYAAMRDGRPIAFASFHVGKYEWTLDLMRHASPLPDGTMHALIAQAIADAAAASLPRLSLAAVPLAALCPAPVPRLARLVHRVTGGDQTGLAQFKSAFVPNWQTLYLAASSRPGLALAGMEIARAVRFPPPVGCAPHHLHEDYEFASTHQPWQSRLNTIP